MKSINEQAKVLAKKLGKRIRHLDGLAGLKIDQLEDENIRLRKKLGAIKPRSMGAVEAAREIRDALRAPAVHLGDSPYEHLSNNAVMHLAVWCEALKR